MDKKQLHELIKDAAQRSDEQDAKTTESWRANRWLRESDRLNTFLSVLRGGLADANPDAAKLIEDFQNRAIKGENPLLDAADSNKEKPE